MQENLTIVLPCYNEAENIPSFFSQLLPFAEKKKFKVIAVNDGSIDQTGELLEDFERRFHCMRVLTHKRNHGYGGALKTGLFAVDTEFAITIDADGQHRLEDVERCFACIQESNADLVVGARQNNQSGFYRSTGKILIKLFAKSLFQLPVKDLNSGMKCYRMDEVKQYLGLCPDTMAFSDVILLLMLNERKLVTETPIKVEARSAGSSTIGFHTALTTVSEILNLSVLLRPMTVFFRLGVLFILLGVSWSVFTYTKSCTISAAAIMLIIFGLACFILGLLGEQLSQIRKHLSKRGVSNE